MISAGFAETGPDGATLQDSLVKEASTARCEVRRSQLHGILSGIRGRASTPHSVGPFPRQGARRLSASRALSDSRFSRPTEVRGLGIGSFVSVGNSVDVASVGPGEVLGPRRHNRPCPSLPGVDPRPPSVHPGRKRGFKAHPHRGVSRQAGRRPDGGGGFTHSRAAAGEWQPMQCSVRQASSGPDSIEEMMDLATVLGPAALSGTPGCHRDQRRWTRRPRCETPARATALPYRSSTITPASGYGRCCQRGQRVEPRRHDRSAATAIRYGRRSAPRYGTRDRFRDRHVQHAPDHSASDVAAELIAAASDSATKGPYCGLHEPRWPPARLCERRGFLPSASPRTPYAPSDGPSRRAERREKPVGRLIRPEVDAQVVGRSSPGQWSARPRAGSPRRRRGLARCLRSRPAPNGPGENSRRSRGRLGRTRVHCSGQGLGRHPQERCWRRRLGVSDACGGGEAVRKIRAEMESAGLTGLATELMVQEQIESGQEMIVGVNRDTCSGHLSWSASGANSSSCSAMSRSGSHRSATSSSGKCCSRSSPTGF